MVLQIPENLQLLLGSSADSMAELPQQAFALTLSDDVLEDMIESIQNGHDIQLSLGDTPSFLYADHEYRIPQSSPQVEYDLFFTNSTAPKSLERLPNPTMPILNPKSRNTLLKQIQAGKGKAKAKPKPKESKEATPRNAAPRAPTQAEKERADIDAMAARFQQAEAEKLENSTRIIEGAVEVKGGKLAKPGKAKLVARPSGLPRSQPGSPALSGVGSPSLGPTSNNQAQEKAKKLRFPLIHELAVRDLTFGELLPKWEGETEAEFHTHLEKVAHFDEGLQKWVLKQPYWKELDVFAYPYEKDEDRQKAIDNAIRKYDRLRFGVSDPLWQKLLPKSERGKGICLSKVQAAIAKGPVAPAPKINVQAAEASSPSVDSEKEETGSNSSKKAKGGEPMARSNSGNKTKKTSEAQAQAKRLLSNKPTAAKTSSAKSSPKVSPTKPTAKAAGAKGGRVLSKEFISDSDSDSSEEAPLAKTAVANKKTLKAKEDLKVRPQPAQRATEKPKQTEKTRDVPAPKPKPVAAKPSSAPKVLDSIRAEGAAKPAKAPKRSREEEDDSSSSGTPLSKRFKVKDQAVVSKSSQPSQSKHRQSDASQNSRGSSSTTSSAKVKTSPVKSSPLASSPPTNASDLDPAEARDTIVAAKKRKYEAADRHEKSDSSDSSSSKRPKYHQVAEISTRLRDEAHMFKSFYASYEALHRELSALEDPPGDKVTKLVQMHERLSEMKQKIRDEVGYTSSD